MTGARRSWYVASAALLGIIVFGIILLYQTANFRTTVEHLIEEDVREKTESAAHILGPLIERGAKDKIAAWCQTQRKRGIRVTVVDKKGAVLVDTDNVTGNHGDRAEIQQAWTSEGGVVVRRSATLGSYWLYCARRVGDHVVRLAVPYNEVSRPVQLARNGLVAAAVIGACAVVLVFFLTRRLATRVELQDVQLAAARANEVFRRDFTSNVSHELRTPLTAILGAVEMMEDAETLSPENRADLQRIIRTQASRLNALAKDVLSLARIECEQTEDKSRDFADICIPDILKNVQTLEAPRAEEKGVRLAATCPEPLHIRGDADLIEQALVNLIENALRYSGSDRIDIAARKADGSLVLSVTDYGIGIPARHLPHIFERFYRVDKARSRSVGGTGLGLAIVKHIAILHGGTVSVESVQGSRTQFKLVLPLASSRT